MRVEIWSDVVCPWCYIGKRRLESALGRFEHRDEVEVIWRAFELDPGAPVEREGEYTDRLAAKYGVPLAEAEAMVERMTRVGDDEGVDMRFDRARPGNTFDAHRLLHLAGERGMQDALKERLLAATFTEGRPIGRPETLAEVAVEAGLDRDEAREVLGGDRFGADVRADEQQARAFGITGVPFFAVDRTYGVPGAQNPDILLDVLRQAWADTHPTAEGSTNGSAATATGPGTSEATGPDQVIGAGRACDGDTCAV